MSKHILFFHPYQFLPPNAGNYRRSFQILCGLRALGYRVTVASIGSNWKTSGDINADLAAAGLSTKDVHLMDISPAEKTWLGRSYRLFGMANRTPPDWLIARLTEPKRQFHRLLNAVSPDYLFVTYMMADTFIDHERYTIPTMIDSIDLTTLNRRMWRQLEPCLPGGPISASQIAPEALELDYWSRQGLTADPEEFATYDRYDQTIAIVQQEADAIYRNTKRTSVHTIPHMQAPVYQDNTYDADAFLPGGPNPFNLQGILFFTKHVLPRVLSTSPDFCLHITGPSSQRIAPQSGIRLTPFVELKEAYRRAPFLICAAFGGTGQQVKITEALAHGVPVVALRAAAERSCLRHGVNGLIADSAEELADHVLTLWNDRRLCRRLGESARQMVAVDLSDQCLLVPLSRVLMNSQRDAMSRQHPVSMPPSPGLLPESGRVVTHRDSPEQYPG